MLEKYNESLFDNIKHIDEDGNEYWSARELMLELGYSNWNSFKKVIEKAKTSCSMAKFTLNGHFVYSKEVDNNRLIENYKLSWLACYLIVQNADPSKEAVAKAQTYLFYKTRAQEIIENMESEKFVEYLFYNNYTNSKKEKRNELKG